MRQFNTVSAEDFLDRTIVEVDALAPIISESEALHVDHLQANHLACRADVLRKFLGASAEAGV